MAHFDFVRDVLVRFGTKVDEDREMGRWEESQLANFGPVVILLPWSWLMYALASAFDSELIWLLVCMP